MIELAILNLKCKKCGTAFDFNVGKVTFGNKLSFENSVSCIKCGLVEIDDLELTELGQTQVAELFLR
ncbi:MAG TPA: hypothetical protein C5S51_01095 [Methanosarcinaceae archaeon]|nr:hypothetical protein [Methanosarcinaceae archaeon]